MNEPLSPNGLFDGVYDRFGTPHDLREIVADSNAAPVNSNALAKHSQTICSNTGYFELWFEDGCGMTDLNDPTETARRDVICQVFSDLAAFIIPADPTTKVRIWIRDFDFSNPSASPDVLGTGTPYYTLAAGLSNGSILDNQIWKTINSGIDAYSDIASPVVVNSNISLNYYHGCVAFDFNNGVPFHTDLYNAPGGISADLYTVALHEICHALGFHSLVNTSFPPLPVANGTGLNGLNLYNRFDTYLQTQANQNMIDNTGNCQMYGYSYALPNTNFLQPNSPSCGTNLQFAGNVNQDAYTPSPWEIGSSLSHLDDVCHTPNGYANMGEYYVMAPNVIQGPLSQKRFLKPEEKQVLCDIGYRVNGTYGNVPHSSYVSYTAGGCGQNLAGVNDGLGPNNAYLYVIPSGSTSYTFATGQQILGNDFTSTSGGTSNLSFTCLQPIMGGGAVSVTNGTALTTNITYTPWVASGLCLLRYIPVDNVTGKVGNITYIFIIREGLCDAYTPCSLVPNGDFELNQGCGPLNLGAIPATVSCWSGTSFTPDIYIWQVVLLYGQTQEGHIL